MSEDCDHTIATAAVMSEETPYGVRIDTGRHALRGDEPADHGGADTGPAPFGLLLSGPGGNRDLYHHRGGLTCGGAVQAVGELIP